MDNPFKVGDKVKAIKAIPSLTDNHPDILPGETGKIISVSYLDKNPENGDMEVEFNGTVWTVNHQDIEKVGDIYTVGSGRYIYKNGKPFIYIGRESGMASPNITDQMAHVIAHLLNQDQPQEANTQLMPGARRVDYQED